MPDMTGVEIFGVGTWKGNKFVAGDLLEIVDNTMALLESGKHKPPIKLGHSTNQIIVDQDDGDPALGRAVDFKVKGDKIIANFVNLPDILFNAIEAQRFTSVSVEMDHIRHFGWFISAVAVIGADLPAVKTLDDLQAFLSDTPFNPATMAGDDVDASKSLNFSTPFFSGDKTKMGDNNKTTTEPTTVKVELSQSEDLKAKIKELEDALELEKTGKVKLTEDMQKEITAYKDKEVEMTFSTRKESILNTYSEDVKKGKLTPAIRDEIEEHLDSQKATFSENSELTISPELTRKVATSYTLEKEETGQDKDQGEDKSPDLEFSQKAKKLQVDKGISYKEASDLVAELEPGLQDEYLEWAEKAHSMATM